MSQRDKSQRFIGALEGPSKLPTVGFAMAITVLDRPVRSEGIYLRSTTFTNPGESI